MSLYVAHYNLCRWHETIRCTPAEALGLTDQPWSIGELLEAAKAAIRFEKPALAALDAKGRAFFVAIVRAVLRFGLS